MAAQALSYSVDSSALIQGWRLLYRPRSFPSVWQRLELLAQEGRLRASVEVYREIEKKDDELFGWCKERKQLLVVELDDECLSQVGRIMGTYPRLVDTVKGRSEGDPFVIALAATGTPPMTVVTEEHPGKMRIPDVCTSERLQCIRLADLIEQENWSW